MIDSIQHNVTKATDFVEDVKQNVHTAVITRNQTKKVKNFI